MLNLSTQALTKGLVALREMIIECVNQGGGDAQFTNTTLSLSEWVL
jgi:hypothetical protein